MAHIHNTPIKITLMLFFIFITNFFDKYIIVKNYLCLSLCIRHTEQNIPGILPQSIRKPIQHSFLTSLFGKSNSPTITKTPATSGANEPMCCFFTYASQKPIQLHIIPYTPNSRKNIDKIYNNIFML